MKTNYTVKNFRVFDKNGATVEFAPLTFLVGCNSSGKSSIVKSLTLLKTFFKNKFDKDEGRKKFKEFLNENHYWLSREWAYKNVKPRIIAEKYIESL